MELNKYDFLSKNKSESLNEMYYNNNEISNNNLSDDKMKSSIFEQQEKEYSTHFISFKNKIDRMNSDINFLQSRLNSIETLASKSKSKSKLDVSQEHYNYRDIINYTEQPLNNNNLSTLNFSTTYDADKLLSFEKVKSKKTGNNDKLNKNKGNRNASENRSKSVINAKQKSKSKLKEKITIENIKKSEHEKINPTLKSNKISLIDLEPYNSNNIAQENLNETQVWKNRAEILSNSFYKIINQLKQEINGMKLSYTKEIAILKENSEKAVEVTKSKYDSVLKKYESNTIKLRKENKQLKNKLDKIQTILNNK